MRLPLFLLLLRVCLLGVPVAAWAQNAADATPASAYPRPDLSATALDLRNLQLDEARLEPLMEILRSLARNFPNEPALSLEWRARILALALRLQPEDRSCLVANGQLARGLMPRAHPDPARRDLRTLTSLLLQSTSDLLKEETDMQSPTAALALHLLDLTAHLNPANRPVFNLFMQDAPPLAWKKMVPQGVGSDDEETPDLLLTRAQVSIVVRGSKPGEWLTAKITARATKLPPATPRKPLQLHLPVEIEGDLEKHLSELRKLLRTRIPRWPGGWSITIDSTPEIPMDQPAALLGIGVVLNALITGIDTDPGVHFLCGLDPAAGHITRFLDLADIPAIASQWNASSLLVLPEIFTDEINDLRIAQPERYAALRKLNLCMASNLQECASLASAIRPPALERGLRQFIEIQGEYKSGVITAVRTPAMKGRLEDIMNFCPRYLSPRLLLEDTFKTPPTILSLKGSVAILNQIGHPILKAGTKRFPIRSRWPDKLDATPWAKAKGQIERLRPRLAPDARAYADALCDLAKIYDQMVLYPPFTPIDKAEVNRRINTATLVLKAATQKLSLEEISPPPPEDAAEPPP